MSESLSTISSISHLLLPHPRRSALLLLPEQGGWALPKVTPTDPHFGVVAQLNEAVQRNLGLEVITLRSLGDDWQPDVTHINSMYELENLTPDARQPEGSRWVDYDDVSSLALAIPEHRPYLDDWFREQATGRPDLRRPWARPGWFQDVSAWMEQKAREADATPIGPVRQLRNWERSTVLQLPTQRGQLYYKAAPAPLAQEGPLLNWLSERFPGEVTTVVALDKIRGGFLMQDLGAVPLHETGHVARYEQVVRRYAQMQRAIVGDLPDIPRYASASLAEHVDALLARLPDLPAPLAPQDLERLRAFGPQLKSLCEQLAACGIPDTLEHGDFWPTNVALREEQAVFFDFSDATVTHPFFSLRLFLAEMDSFLPHQPDARERIVKAYLSAWEGMTTPEPLSRTYQLSRPVAAFHAALLYVERILPALEAKWEMQNMAMWALHDLLRELEALA
ncbi:phosphotransferase [Deinococcus ficus]|uniref:phosphotransferase n=1 Tax=Deinococcus ficus TaxID=317577 RepID=UPI0003B743FE|nr:phosphotransferase [Deinococcus ficus]